jgi:RNA polymerase sigma-70 factor, ECF subfamily
MPVPAGDVFVTLLGPMHTAGQQEEARLAPAAPSPQEIALVESLRRREEAAFVELLELYSAALLRLALTFVRTRAVAEEVVQETWVGVLKGIDRFEGRSSLRTWIFRILTNVAKTRAVREGRSAPFSDLEAETEEGPLLDPSRFVRVGEAWEGHWQWFPGPWGEPEERLLASEARAVIATAIDALPTGQRAVVTLRDVEGWSSEETCNALEISETNQRVLLHRARTKVRLALETYLTEAADAQARDS